MTEQKPPLHRREALAKAAMLRKKESGGCGDALLALAVFISLGLLLLLGATAIFMWAWGLFISPVFDLPLLDMREAFGALVILAVIRFVFASGGSISNAKR